MKHPNEYLEPYDWAHHGDKTPNDYRSKDDRRTTYQNPPMTSEELNDFLEEMELDAIL